MRAALPLSLIHERAQGKVYLARWRVIHYSISCHQTLQSEVDLARLQHYAQHERVCALRNVIWDKTLLFNTADYFKSQRKQPQWLRLIGRVPRALWKLCIVRSRLHYRLEKWNVTSEFQQMESRRWLTGLNNSSFVYNEQLVSSRLRNKTFLVTLMHPLSWC